MIDHKLTYSILNNRGQTEFRLNMFADMTPEEFKAKMLLKNDLNKPRELPREKQIIELCEIINQLNDKI